MIVCLRVSCLFGSLLACFLLLLACSVVRFACLCACCGLSHWRVCLCRDCNVTYLRRCFCIRSLACCLLACLPACLLCFALLCFALLARLADRLAGWFSVLLWCVAPSSVSGSIRGVTFLCFEGLIVGGQTCARGPFLEGFALGQQPL